MDPPGVGSIVIHSLAKYKAVLHSSLQTFFKTTPENLRFSPCSSWLLSNLAIHPLSDTLKSWSRSPSLIRQRQWKHPGQVVHWAHTPLTLAVITMGRFESVGGNQNTQRKTQIDIGSWCKLNQKTLGPTRIQTRTCLAKREQCYSSRLHVFLFFFHRQYYYS